MNLRIPGPTPLPPQVREALQGQMINHRGREFGQMVRAIAEQLKHFFQTENDLVILTGSGTGAMEAAIVNTCSSGEKVLAVSIGNFGDRFAAIARAFGLDVTKLDFPGGHAAEPQAVADALDRNPDITTVLITHNETSTGVTNPLADLARVVKERNKLLVVDGISSVASIDLKTDEWGCDVVLSGSQKGWMVPPGLAFASISPFAWERHAAARLPRVYWDFAEHKKYLDRGETPWTPAVSIFYALRVALDMMEQEGREEIFARHERVAQRCRDRAVAAGMSLFADQRYASNTVTAFYTPEGIDSRSIATELEDEFDTVVALGQAQWTNTSLRIGHLGWVNESDIDRTMDALEKVLSRTQA
ncbi:MAG: alanine--glyoxylate aminotransferase family protein [Betaproteobacteria bacterium]|nr:alanine--glyoxylate aminotransferase family protein [Betaproteobacteria bacterium]